MAGIQGLLGNDTFMAGMGLLSGSTPQVTPPNPVNNMFQGLQAAGQIRQQQFARQQEQQRALQLEQAIRSLPPQLQAAARINPDILKEYYKPQTPVNVQPGAALVDPVTGTPIYRAPFKPDAMSSERFEQAMRLAAQRGGNAFRVTGYDNEGRPLFEYGEGGATSTDTKPSVTKIEGQQQSGIQALNDLVNIGSRYNDEYLTYQGKMKGWYYGMKDKAGVSSEEEQNFIGMKTQFDTAVDRMFNQYRKEITGAAASVQELDRLKKTMLNTDMSPAQFRAAYNDFVAITRQQLELNTRLKESGLSDDEIRVALDNAFYQMTGNPVSEGVGAQDTLGWSMERASN